MSNGNPSTTALENDIAAIRDRLAGTIDELTERAAPQNVMAREKAKVQARFTAATHTPEGDLRTDRLAIAGAVVVGLVVLKVLSSRRSRRW